MGQKQEQNKFYINCRFIETSHAAPGKMYGLIMTHKVGQPVKVIISGYGTAIENLSIFFGKQVIFRGFKN